MTAVSNSVGASLPIPSISLTTMSEPFSMNGPMFVAMVSSKPMIIVRAASNRTGAAIANPLAIETTIVIASSTSSGTSCVRPVIRPLKALTTLSTVSSVISARRFNAVINPISATATNPAATPRPTTAAANAIKARDPTTPIRFDAIAIIPSAPARVIKPLAICSQVKLPNAVRAGTNTFIAAAVTNIADAPNRPPLARRIAKTTSAKVMPRAVRPLASASLSISPNSLIGGINCFIA